MSRDIILAPGDIVLMKSGGLVGWAIRVFTRNIGERRTKATHTGVIVEGGPIENAVIVEALATVKRHSLWARYAGAHKEVAVFRPLNLTAADLAKVVAKAETYVGRRYGYLKLLAHWADWVLQGAYVFRRLANQDRYPICSWVVAYAFAEAGKHFGVEPGAATPDDIWDFVTGNRDLPGSRGAGTAVFVTCASLDPPDDRSNNPGPRPMATATPTYTCQVCGMSVNMTCAKCDAELVHDSITKDDGTKVAVSKCPKGHGKIKSPMCCARDMTCSV